MTFCCQVTFFFQNAGKRCGFEFYFSEFVFAGQCHFVATSCDRKFVPHRRARTLQPLRESTYQGIALLTFPHRVIWAPSSWLCSVTKLKGHRRKSAGLLPNDIAFEFLFFFCLCGLLVDGWMGWCWWGRWWDGQHGGGSGVRPRMRLSGRGESRFVRAPSEVDFSSHYRKYETFWPNCQIEETPPICLEISQLYHYWSFWSYSSIHIAGNGGNVYFWNILGKSFFIVKSC